MAAVVLVIEVDDWPVVKKYLDKMGEGAILVPPDVAKQFKEETGKDISNGKLISYDFGGDPDIWLDIMHSTDTYAATGISHDLEHVKPKK